MTPRAMERELREKGYSRKAAKTAVAGMREAGMLQEQPKPSIFKRLLNAAKGVVK